MTDVNADSLRSSIPKDLGIHYLEKVSEKEARKVPKCIDGYIWGHNRRWIFSCVVSNNDKDRAEARRVIFILVTCFPTTCLAPEVGVSFLPIKYYTKLLTWL